MAKRTRGRGGQSKNDGRHNKGDGPQHHKSGPKHFAPYHAPHAPRTTSNNPSSQQPKTFPYNPSNYAQYWHLPPQGQKLWEGNQILPDLPPPGSNYMDLHNNLLVRADASRELFVRFQQEIQTQFKADGSGRGLWDFLQQFTGVDNGMCMFMHPVGIKKDLSGDTLMSDGPSLCECMTGNFLIPECFLRAFFYLITVSNHRKEVLVKLQEEKNREGQQAKTY
ncbi:hypothetical protein OQA88_4714 [Cercophora sp. LCS_1]